MPELNQGLPMGGPLLIIAGVRSPPLIHTAMPQTSVVLCSPAPACGGALR